MRALSFVLVLTSGVCAFAQEPPLAPLPQPLIAPPLPPPSPETAPALTAPAVRATPSRSLVRQWRGARVMNGFAGAIGIVSTGLALSNAIYVAADHYPPNLGDFTKRPGPGDPAQTLSFVSASSAAFAFGLSAGGLALRHHILRQLDADPGRGLFLSGTIVGVAGIAAIAASYIVGFSNVGNPRDQSIAVLATSLGGSTICNVATTMYAKDGSNMQKIWKSLSTF
jgi:hypothetical protein